MSDRNRCSHTSDALGWEHPWRYERPNAHACCLVPGHCPSVDDPPPRAFWEIRTRDSLHLVDLRTDDWAWLRTSGRRPAGEVRRTYRDDQWTAIGRVAALKDRLHDRLPEVGEHLVVWPAHRDFDWIATSVVVSVEKGSDG